MEFSSFISAKFISDQRHLQAAITWSTYLLGGLQTRYSVLSTKRMYTQSSITTLI